MQNKFFGTKLNSVLLVVLIILMVFALRIMLQNKEMYFNGFHLVNPPSQDSMMIVSSLSVPTNWIKSPKFGLFYPKGFDIIEYYELSPAQKAQGVSETQGAPTFTATSSGNAIITWGGNQSACGQDEIKNFQYGISTEACVKGLHALIYPENVRKLLTQDDIKLFSSFVLNNK